MGWFSSDSDIRKEATNNNELIVNNELKVTNNNSEFTLYIIAIVQIIFLGIVIYKMILKRGRRENQREQVILAQRP